MTGLTSGSTSELHEQIGYSSPLVLGDRIYVGVADHCDNPIQNGKVKSVHLDSGTVDSGFTYESTNTRGGGVWTFVSGGLGKRASHDHRKCEERHIVGAVRQSRIEHGPDGPGHGSS